MKKVVKNRKFFLCAEKTFYFCILRIAGYSGIIEKDKKIKVML